MARKPPSECERCGRLEQDLHELKERIARLEIELAQYLSGPLTLPQAKTK